MPAAHENIRDSHRDGHQTRRSGQPRSSYDGVQTARAAVTLHGHCAPLKNDHILAWRAPYLETVPISKTVGGVRYCRNYGVNLGKAILAAQYSRCFCRMSNGKVGDSPIRAIVCVLE